MIERQLPFIFFYYYKGGTIYIAGVLYAEAFGYPFCKYRLTGAEIADERNDSRPSSIFGRAFSYPDRIFNAIRDKFH